MTRKPSPKPVRRTVGGAVKVIVAGEEGGALRQRSYVVRLTAMRRGASYGDAFVHVDLNRTETRQLRDALSRILGDV